MFAWNLLVRMRDQVVRHTDNRRHERLVMPLLEALKDRQRRQIELAGAVAAQDAVNVRWFDRKAIEAKVHKAAARWRAMLTTHVEDGRQLLREVLAGPLRFAPEGRMYSFEGEAAFGPLLEGMVGVACEVASPPGFATL
jgi:hypothetical protein